MCAFESRTRIGFNRKQSQVNRKRKRKQCRAKKTHFLQITFFGRKQIQLLESNLERLEQRLHAENKSIEEYYTKKLLVLETDKADIVRKFDEQTTDMVANHEKQLTKLRASHETEIDHMKNDQRMVIENIRQSKLLEFSAIQENGSYLATLRNASSYLETASDNLQTLRTNIDSNIERVNAEREAQLEAREKRVEGIDWVRLKNDILFSFFLLCATQSNNVFRIK